MEPVDDRPVLLFDGVCNLCNSTVQFVIKHDAGKQFLFAALQSSYAKQKLEDLGARLGTVPDSIVLYYKGRFYVKSDAALLVARLLGGWLRLLTIAFVVPRFLRNIVYDWVARHRYRWFGKMEHCMVPTPDLQERFLS
jgi:predicted DCC family thiol-disulfide oxidoreductase YuxK